MNKNKNSTLNTKKLTTRKFKGKSLNLNKWRWLFLTLIKYPCAQRRIQNMKKNNATQSSIAQEIMPWDDDESKLFPN
ncbi:MAG: hypothetical protein QNJ49_00145 [Mastigocoleus sp. MO_167.B18]|nr:hypothetical protein [Mastigocoleus sp. MO_167.B18]